MEKKPKPKKKLIRKLQNKFRLVIMNDENFEEKASLRLSPLNVFVTTGMIILSLITSTIYIIAFTPLREYIPGYADVNMRRNLMVLSLKADSLQNELHARDLYFVNLRSVIDGDMNIDTTQNFAGTNPARYDTMKTLYKSKEDSMLRSMIESQDKYELAVNTEKTSSGSIASFFFFPPVKGTLINTFDRIGRHYGVDVLAGKDEGIKATLDGTVVLATWTNDTGYIIALQHSNNIFSLYKHNSALLKKVGTVVKAGEVIAIIGNTGEFTSGPHLHFELWHNGSPINPKDYITF